MAEIVISVVAKVAEYLVSPVARPIVYIWNYTTNFDILKKEVEKLESKRDTVQRSVDDARRKSDEIEQHVNNWLERAESMIAEASLVIRENEQANMKCVKGLCPNPKKHYQHSRKAAKKGKAVAELRGEGNFATVSYPTIPREIWNPAHKGYEDFESRMSVLENIRKELSNSEVNMIGIYGTGGIGKTTLARKVAAHAEDNKLFNVVAFAEVTTEPDIKVIQQKIAEKLGLTFPEETASGRARRLHQRLMQEEKVFLILDNIWEELKLEDVGIPFGNDHKGCKVLLTARSSDVLSKMDSQSNFQIDLLDEGEALSLLKKTAGDCIENNDPVQILAIEVAKACGGLPIAITTVAKALKGKEVPVWKAALDELKRPSARSFEGVAAETYASIEISYNQLRSKELKSIFLLCSIMGYTSIEDLLAYGMGLGMFEGTRTIEEARNRVIALVQQLKDSSLLLDANNKRFLLHDVVRDVARSIASRDGHMIVETGDVIPRELIDKHVLRKCIKISLHAISEFPMELECPQLEFFYMKSKERSLKVPDKFFTRMLELKVLHLNGLDLDLVSNSLNCLVNLQTLNIIQCNLHDFHFIGELKQLKFLGISDVDFEELPKEMCNLSELRLLNLIQYRNLKDIPPNVLSTLTHLEELYLFKSWRSNIKWEVAGFKILDELKRLSFLTTLEINIPNANDLPKGNFLSNKLERYRIWIGDNDHPWMYSFDMDDTSRELKLNLGNSSCSDDVPHKMSSVEEFLSTLNSHKMSSVEEFLSTLNSQGFPELEVLGIQNSSCFRIVVDCLKSEFCDPFPCLKSLILYRLYELEKIYDYQLKAESFHQLTTIRVHSCDKLKNIFSFSTNRVLPWLQDVTVGSCNNMEEIFAMAKEEDINNDEGTDQIEFKQLCLLSLTSLPKLTNFCKMNNDEVCASNPFFNRKVEFCNLDELELECINFEKIWHNELSIDSSCFQCLRKLTIKECKNVKVLFSSSTVAFPSLEIIEISKMDDLEMIWSNQLCKDSFCNLKSMEVVACNKLLTIFSSTMLERITRLKSLIVEHCDVVEKIFDLQGINFEESHSRTETTPLQELGIEYQPNLEHILIKDLQNRFSFQKLEVVKVHDCGSLKYLFPISIAMSLPKLENLVVSKCEMENIVEDEGEAKEAIIFVFPQIISLTLSNLPKLKTFYQGVHTSQWPNLTELHLGYCQKMESFASEFFNFQVNNENQHDSSIQSFLVVKKDPLPNLEKLVIDTDLKLILQFHFPEQLCCKIKFLEVRSDKSVVFSLGMLQRFRNLRQLHLEFCSYQVLYSYEEAEILDPSKSKCDSKPDTILPKIESLSLGYCWNLIQLVPSSVSFQNLTFLDVSLCNGLKNLLMSSTAKSLVQLRKMKVIGCNSMIEVVAKEEDVTEDNIIFPKLRALTLSSLPSLICFCSGNYNFELPSLEELKLNRCPQLKYFSSGDVTTPILQKVMEIEGDRKLEGDLNTTIQQLQHSRTTD